VCDSGDFATIDKYKPQDATTNPSLILAASKKAGYAKLIDAAVAYGKKHGSSIDDQVDASLDNLLVQFGSEILKIIPGRVSTEVDARFSFDTKASVNKALHILEVCLLSTTVPEEQKLMFRSSTKRWESQKTVFSSRSLRRGRASRPPRSCRHSTVSIAT
jgi:transaldolase